jgi:hypothetical protein
MRFILKALFLIVVFILFPGIVYLHAHTTAYDLTNLSGTQIGFFYLQLGYKHIIPLGYDHILFVFGLFLLDPRIKNVIAQATAFTIAHSLTLGLAMLGIIQPVNSVIEPIIALSILFIAVENILLTEVKWWRILVVFIFGLIHGCGFASALHETGLPEKDFGLALFTFNAGVELGQITIILLAYMLIGKWFSGKVWYKKRITIPLSICIAVFSIYWTVERIFIS